METKSLLKPTVDEQRAVDQLKQIMDSPLDSPFALTSGEWQRTARLWLVISKGHYIPMLEKKDEKRLRNAAIRLECEGVIRRYSLTLQQAARDLDVKLKLVVSR